MRWLTASWKLALLVLLALCGNVLAQPAATTVINKYKTIKLLNVYAAEGDTVYLQGCVIKGTITNDTAYVVRCTTAALADSTPVAGYADTAGVSGAADTATASHRCSTATYAASAGTAEVARSALDGGGGSGYQVDRTRAGAFRSPAANYGEYWIDAMAGGFNEVVRFDASTPETVYSCTDIPRSITGTDTASYAITGYAATAQAAHVVYALSYSIDGGAWQTDTITVPTIATQDSITSCVYSQQHDAWGWSGGEHVNYKLWREALHAADSLVSDYYLLQDKWEQK